MFLESRSKFEFPGAKGLQSFNNVWIKIYCIPRHVTRSCAQLSCAVLICAFRSRRASRTGFLLGKRPRHINSPPHMCEAGLRFRVTQNSARDIQISESILVIRPRLPLKLMLWM